MNKKLGMIVAIGAAVILIGAVGISMASDYSNTNIQEKKVGDHNGYRDGECTGEPKLKMIDKLNLTEEQEQEIRDTVVSMGDNGSRPQEIRDTVRDIVEDYGAELPETMGEGQRDMHRQRRGKCSGEN
ncbi:MAG: hypothetical protein V5A66_03460 [Candidatus Thermoplasmatota archaeon]